MKRIFLLFTTFVALAATFFIFAACFPESKLDDFKKPVDDTKDEPASKPSVPLPPATETPDETEVPDEPEVPKAPEPVLEYRVIFVADGETVAEIAYISGAESVDEPSVPEREGYTGRWAEYTLGGGDITVEAVYERIVYAVEFIIGGEVYESAEIYFGERLPYPEIPEVEHFTSEWGEPVEDGLKITVNAVYMAVNYTVTFVSEGLTVAEITYNVIENEIDVPRVPDKEFYFGKWEEYDLDGGDKTVNAVYEPVTYYVEFVIDGKVLDTQYYNVESGAVTAPVLPERAGFEGSWSGYSLSGGNITVNAIYSALNATEGLEYKAVGGGYVVKGYSGTDTRVIVPAEFNGKPVSGIADEAFFNSKIEEVHICEGVESIGYGAFYKCGSLKKVLLSEGLKEIGESAFACCGVLESISLPSGVERLSTEAFAKSGLKEIIFSEGLTEIGERAFYMCCELTEVTLPDSLEILGESAFRSCRALKTVTLGKNLSFIGSAVFCDCVALERVVFYDAEGWLDDPKNYQSNLPELLAKSPESAAEVFLTYPATAFEKKRGV